MKWSKVWKIFDAWCEDEAGFCPTCNKPHHRMAGWGTQKKKIQEIVDTMLKEKK